MDRTMLPAHNPPKLEAFLEGQRTIKQGHYRHSAEQTLLIRTTRSLLNMLCVCYHAQREYVIG